MPRRSNLRSPPASLLASHWGAVKQMGETFFPWWRSARQQYQGSTQATACWEAFLFSPLGWWLAPTCSSALNTTAEVAITFVSILSTWGYRASQSAQDSQTSKGWDQSLDLEPTLKPMPLATALHFPRPLTAGEGGAVATEKGDY